MPECIDPRLERIFADKVDKVGFEKAEVGLATSLMHGFGDLPDIDGMSHN